MVDANILPTEEALVAFNDVKMNKKLRYALYKISNDDKEIALEQSGDLTATWADFLKLLPRDEPRFAVFDYAYETDEKPPRHLSKLIFIGWSPDNSAVKKKMIYSSAKVSFKNKLGIAKDLQATDLSDLDTKVIEKF